MGLIKRLVLLAGTVGSAFLIYKLFVEPHPIPKVEDEYWGLKSEEGKKEDTSIRPFKISTPAAIVEDFKARLRRELESNRLVPPLEGHSFEYGFNSNYLKEVGQYWLNRYNWGAREKLLNRFLQYKTKIGGLDIHFYHVKPDKRNGKAPRPLLLLHGWPGSIVEFQKIIPLLSEPKNAQNNYELVIPSLPGYGFSDAAVRPGLSTTEMGNIFKRLMERLGHKKFFVMGGDWGAIITSDMATLYPDQVIAAQSNLCTPTTAMGGIRYLLASLLPNIFMSPEERIAVPPVGKLLAKMARESGYAHMHATKPDTIGVGVTHSPLALASYILEKFSTWTNSSWYKREDGGLLENFTLDMLLDNVMIYWVTGSTTTSMRLYAESANPTKKHNLDRVPTNVPFSCQFMRNEIMIMPEFSLKDKFTNLTRYSITKEGGHFGAFEEPHIVAEDAISHFENY